MVLVKVLFYASGLADWGFLRPPAVVRHNRWRDSVGKCHVATTWFGLFPEGTMMSQYQ